MFVCLFVYRKRALSEVEFGFPSEMEIGLRRQPSDEPPITFKRGDDGRRVPGDRCWSDRHSYFDADMIDVEGVDCNDLMEVEFHC